ncbi:SDR family NAD(P)-dependent oxidoreductase [Sinorhizobium americanum]|uniref:Osmolarity sensor protein EnvZ n=1 Tax=Sinorhizobium americanum TaxID=194963 RepID=A0A1L3LZH0_9HYPH|nr:SDR family NAD(P)-dependent oxidoreductase [Sinorhizobium americanum]APG95507.1 osmolarity sensor protein EnvZ [Sinorhizobium americanum]OAP45992.1 short-chain dehydrogenase [Sinorhizobium americanum]
MTNWFITGISRGLGRALATAALARGDTVVGTARSGSFSLDHEFGTLHVLAADLGAQGSAEASVTRAFELVGTIDVVVNNAGHGLLGAVESATDQEVQALFAVDFFAPLRIIQTALPHLRKQGSGHIINITSIAGRAPTTGTAIYTAAKSALEGLSMGLALEVAPLGVKVTAVAPGAFRTDFLSPRSIQRSGAADAAYSETIGRSAAAFETADGHQVGDPELAAMAIIALADSDDPPLHLLLGSDALARARAKLERVIEEIDAWESVTRITDFREQSGAGDDAGGQEHA